MFKLMLDALSPVQKSFRNWRWHIVLHYVFKKPVFRGVAVTRVQLVADNIKYKLSLKLPCGHIWSETLKLHFLTLLLQLRNSWRICVPGRVTSQPQMLCVTPGICWCNDQIWAASRNCLSFYRVLILWLDSSLLAQQCLGGARTPGVHPHTLRPCSPEHLLLEASGEGTSFLSRA